jgi:uncharacterized protein (DUF433 family)
MSTGKSNSALAIESAPSFIPIQQDPEKLSGAPTIGPYRVHAVTLIDYLMDGGSIADFLEDFEGTPPEYVKGVLAVVRQAIEKGMLTGIEMEEAE